MITGKSNRQAKELPAQQADMWNCVCAGELQGAKAGLAYDEPALHRLAFRARRTGRRATV
ncbi:hypothetical protein J8I87_20295 [Paraburkholderia sp. LEh10]|uniref:hypothetical protein n=1 Tax=Paraburkholderia sp. LEh10 TaxID=2821353 RepID=UPI001AEB31F0|nr:hypothetical protein [Paraburkholderia sp. LEh10]MBP0592024.1 hypothetical protein [Paraburkholderia sp. LEh10]